MVDTTIRQPRRMAKPQARIMLQPVAAPAVLGSFALSQPPSSLAGAAALALTRDTG